VTEGKGKKDRKLFRPSFFEAGAFALWGPPSYKRKCYNLKERLTPNAVILPPITLLGFGSRCRFIFTVWLKQPLRHILRSNIT
jgi:hypothetical protein